MIGGVTVVPQGGSSGMSNIQKPTNYICGLTLDRDALILSPSAKGSTAMVKDASDDPTVESGWALYSWDGETWTKTAEGESVDSVPQAMYIESNIPNNNSKLALHFELQIYSDATYDTPVESFNSSDSQANIELYDGTDWVAMAAGGAVLAYYGNKIRFALQAAVAGTMYYTRIRTLWFNDPNWESLSGWHGGTYPNFSLHIPDITPVAVAALTKSSNTNASAYHKHSSVEYGAGAKSGAVSLDFSRGDYQQIATVAATPITSLTMINSESGDLLVIEIDNANATTVTAKAFELIGTGETGKYLIYLRNIGGTIMAETSKTEIEE